MPPEARRYDPGMNARKPALICVLALCVPLLAPAADKSHGCSRVQDDAGRLACYDAAFGKPVPPASRPVAEPAAAPPPAPKVEARPAAVITADKDRKADKEKQPRDRVTAVVAEVSITPRGLHTVTLDNGEVWRQLEPDQAVVIETGDTISLRSGALGSYQLVTKTDVRTRVTRVK